MFKPPGLFEPDDDGRDGPAEDGRRTAPEALLGRTAAAADVSAGCTEYTHSSEKLNLLSTLICPCDASTMSWSP